jgi:hypothetical protein
MSKRKEEERKERKVLSYEESFTVGALTGGVEVTTNLPLWTIKTRAQSDLPFTLNPAVLYRGYPVALASMTLITAMQITNSSVMEHSVLHADATVSYRQRIGTAFAGGAASALIFGPLDLIGTQWHKHNYNSFIHAFKATYKTVGIRGLAIGTPATAITDGIITCAFWGVYAPCKKTIAEYYPNKYVSSLVAGLLTGLAAAIISHPADIIKTRQQLKADESNKSIATYFKEMYQKPGGFGFYKAIVPRMVWLTSMVTVAGLVAENLETVVDTFRGNKPK